MIKSNSLEVSFMTSSIGGIPGDNNNFDKQVILSEDFSKNIDPNTKIKIDVNKKIISSKKNIEVKGKITFNTNSMSKEGIDKKVY
jgi:hypothetical protein